MKRGDKYNFKDQSERLVYMEKRDNWHQFGLVQTPNTVWLEVLDSDLHLLEKTKDENMLEALQQEIKRNEELLEEYKKVPAGRLAGILIDQELKQAKKSVTDGDTVQMIKSLETLRGNN